MSRALHGDPKTAQMDQLICGMLEVLGYKVIVVQSRDLDDPQAVRQHLKSIAQALGRSDLAEAIQSGAAPQSTGTAPSHDSAGGIPPDPWLTERRRLAEEALKYCNESCRRHVQTCIDHDFPLPVVGFELQDDEGRVCADAELAWEDRLLAVLLPERSESMEAFQQQGWTVFLAPGLTDEQLRELLSE